MINYITVFKSIFKVITADNIEKTMINKLVEIERGFYIVSHPIVQLFIVENYFEHIEEYENILLEA